MGQPDQQQRVAWGPTKSLKPGIAWGRVCLYLFLTVSLVFFLVLSIVMDVFAAGAPDGDGWFVPAFIWGASYPTWFLLGYVRKVWALKAFGVLVASILLLSLFSWHPRHRFVDTLYSIQAGTSKAAALEVMSPYLDKTPWLDRPRESFHESGSVLSFRWCDTGWRYNADMGLIYLRGGHVTRVDFRGD